MTRAGAVTQPDALAIRVSDLRKAYRVYDRKFDFLKEAFTGRTYHRDREVLRGIDLDVRRGEVVGIIGRNGAGKSTLLKVLAGTLAPTSGRVEIEGRVSAILELGTGFNAAYSGRENVFMSALMRGLGEQQIEAKFDSIVDFAGLRDVIDEPFHTYSSGMQARLAFAAAVAVDADVLIIDEALAAGDIRFAARCIQRIHEICRGGVTALFVSHVSYHVMQLCNRAVWIDEGRVRMDGEPVDVVRAYEYEMHEAIARDQGRMRALEREPESQPNPPVVAVQPVDAEPLSAVPAAHAEGRDEPVAEVPRENGAAPTDVPERVDTAPRQSRFSSGQYRITTIEFLDADGRAVEAVRFGAVLRLRVGYACLLEDVPPHSCGLAVAFNRKSDFEAVMYFNTNYPHSDEELRRYDDAPFRRYRGHSGVIEARLDPVQLRPGEYYVSFGILPNQPGPHEFYEYHHCEFTMRVLPSGFEEPSVFYPMVTWTNGPER
jgi:ABC-type polysaccharide/polyol phosphate transport system ATPase subunit